MIEEISRIIRQGYQRAKTVLEQQRESLEEVVQILFEKEVMDGDQPQAGHFHDVNVELNENKSTPSTERVEADVQDVPAPTNAPPSILPSRILRSEISRINLSDNFHQQTPPTGRALTPTAVRHARRVHPEQRRIDQKPR